MRKSSLRNFYHTPSAFHFYNSRSHEHRSRLGGTRRKHHTANAGTFRSAALHHPQGESFPATSLHTSLTSDSTASPEALLLLDCTIHIPYCFIASRISCLTVIALFLLNYTFFSLFGELVQFDASVKHAAPPPGLAEQETRGSWVASALEIDPSSVVYVRRDFGQGQRHLDPERNPRWRKKKTVEVRAHARRVPMRVSNVQRRITRVVASSYEQVSRDGGVEGG
jgi:hypothetical protein